LQFSIAYLFFCQGACTGGGWGGGSTQVKVVATSRANRKLNGQKAVQDRVSLESLSSLSSELLMVLLVV